MITAGGYTQFRNRGTGLLLDGMGSTANGSDLGQYANTTSNNAQWQLIPVSIHNDMGKVVASATFSATQHTINISNLLQRLYILKVTSNRKLIVEKVIKK